MRFFNFLLRNVPLAKLNFTRISTIWINDDHGLKKCQLGIICKIKLPKEKKSYISKSPI